LDSSHKKIELMDYSYVTKTSECLKLLAHPVRIRIVEILSIGLFPVYKIAELCEVAPNQACEHLRLLKNHGLLNSERKGRTVYYKINSSQLADLLNCIKKHCSD